MYWYFVQYIAVSWIVRQVLLVLHTRARRYIEYIECIGILYNIFLYPRIVSFAYTGEQMAARSPDLLKSIDWISFVWKLWKSPEFWKQFNFNCARAICHSRGVPRRPEIGFTKERNLFKNQI